MSRVRRELARNRRVTYRPRIGNEKSTCVNSCRNPWIRSESEIRSAVAVISGTSAIQTAIHINVAYDVLPTVPSVLFCVVERTLDHFTVAAEAAGARPVVPAISELTRTAPFSCGHKKAQNRYSR